MKRKTLTMILCLLTVLSVVGVGFASWVINAGDQQTANGNIEVDTVSDNRLVLTVDALSGDQNNIKLVGANDGTALAGGLTPWLTTDKNSENLVVTYSCTVTKKNNSLFTDNGTLSGAVQTLDVAANFAEPASEVESVKTAYGKAKEAGCFVLRTDDGILSATPDKFYNGVKITTPVLNGDKNQYTFSVTLEYKWGTIFGGLNPYKYYNATQGESPNVTFVRDVKVDCGPAVNGNDSATWGDHAYYYLSLLEDMEDVTYSITISANL